jgi:nickel/cobalt transporter (NicO) family protein
MNRNCKIGLATRGNWTRAEHALLLAGMLVLLATALLLPGVASAGGLNEADPQGTGFFADLTRAMIAYQKRFNAEVALHMNALNSGESYAAFALGLSIAFFYGMVHALGPGHGKFVILSYFMGRDVRIGRGLAIAAQMAIVHVIAAIAIVWIADSVLQAGFGVGLAEIPGVRAASFLIIAGIGIYMLTQAIKATLGSRRAASAGDDHGHSHSHGHDGHSHSHSHAGSGKEGGLLALASGIVPCPGAVLVMLYAIANNMIYPGFLLVVAMSAGIGVTISALGIGAILARQTALRMMEGAGGRSGVVALRTGMNYGGAILVTTIGLISFVAFLDVPIR